MRHTSALSFFIVSFLFLSCSDDPVMPPAQTTVHLKAEGTDYTSITVRLSTRSEFPSGIKEVSMPLQSQIPAGVYFLRGTSGSMVQHQKIVVAP